MENAQNKSASRTGGGGGQALRGCLDRVGRLIIEGWAQNPHDPERAVHLDVVLNGEVVARAVADQYRADLETTGLGSGRHAFSVRLAEPLTETMRAKVIVRRSSDAQALSRPVSAAMRSRAA